VIHGNVVITGNNAVVAACDVFGSLEIRGNNTKLAGNHLVGALSDKGKNSRCDDNHSAIDANANHVLESKELGAVLSCGK
jgi:hypothetical protein